MDYKGFHVTASAVIPRDEQNKEFLLVQSRRKQGLIGIPGGGVFWEEPPTEAVKRETWEETGVHIDLDYFIGGYVYRTSSNNINLHLVWNGTPAWPELSASPVHEDEIERAMWNSYQDILRFEKNEMLRTPLANRKPVKDYLERSVHTTSSKFTPGALFPLEVFDSFVSTYRYQNPIDKSNRVIVTGILQSGDEEFWYSQSTDGNRWGLLGSYYDPTLPPQESLNEILENRWDISLQSAYPFRILHSISDNGTSFVNLVYVIESDKTPRAKDTNEVVQVSTQTRQQLRELYYLGELRGGRVALEPIEQFCKNHEMRDNLKLDNRLIQYLVE